MAPIEATRVAGAERKSGILTGDADDSFPPFTYRKVSPP